MIEKIRASAQGGGVAGPGPEAGNITPRLEQQPRGPPAPGSSQFYNHYDG